MEDCSRWIAPPTNSGLPRPFLPIFPHVGTHDWRASRYLARLAPRYMRYCTRDTVHVCGEDTRAKPPTGDHHAASHASAPTYKIPRIV